MTLYTTISHKTHSKRLFTLLALLPLVVGTVAEAGPTGDKRGQSGCKMERIVPKRLPDLNIPRSGHHTLYINGELTVMGGHTTAFVPTPTLEYFSEGAWHVLQMAYPHDGGLLVPLSHGKALLGGGYEKPLGIGQLFSTEVYDQQTHGFSDFGCLEVSRAMSCGVELEGGKVLISGNWYQKDTMEMYDGKRHFTFVKKVSTGLSNPYVFRTGKDNAVVFGTSGTRGDSLHMTTVDQLKDNPYSPALFETWQPLKIHEAHQSTDYEVGDRTQGDYAYLFPMTDSTGQVAVGLCRNGEFSLLPTHGLIPMKGPEGQGIYYCSLIVDKPRKRAYLRGEDYRTEAEGWAGKHIVRRHYLLRIDYGQAFEGKGEAPLTLYYTDNMDVESFDNPTVTTHGDVVLTGGKKRDNYTPLATVYIFRLGDATAEATSGLSRWLWLLAGIVIAIAAALLLYRRRQQAAKSAHDNAAEDMDSQQKSALMERICQLMDEKKLYLNSDLKLQDVATELGIHPNAVSAVINSKGCSFNQFVNDYRIEYAKQLLREEPDKKVSSIYYEAGFGHEQTFFRAFKARTGKTPTQWKKQESSDHS